MPYTIGSKTFTTKDHAITHCREILYRKPLETEIDGDDENFIRAILSLRADKLQEMGNRTVVCFLRKMHRRNTPSFFAKLSDGSFMDISFMKVINGL